MGVCYYDQRKLLMQYTTGVPFTKRNRKAFPALKFDMAPGGFNEKRTNNVFIN